MKLIRTNNTETVKVCQAQFHFELPNTFIAKRFKKFKDSIK